MLIKRFKLFGAVALVTTVIAVSPIYSQSRWQITQNEFSINPSSFEIIKLSDHAAILSGRIEKCSYERRELYQGKEYYEVREWWPYMRDELRSYRELHRRDPPKTREWGRMATRQRPRTMSRNITTNNYMPKRVSVSVPFTQDEYTASISTDGRFRVEITIDNQHFFSGGADADLRTGYRWNEHEVEIEIRSEHPIEEGRFFREPLGDPWTFNITIWSMSQIPANQPRTATSLLLQECSTTFMTGGNEKRFSSWFDLIDYFNSVSNPPKDEFETESQYRERIQRIRSMEKDFKIYFTPSLSQYSHEAKAFVFSLSFFHSTTLYSNGWDLAWSDEKPGREESYSVRNDDDYLITCNKWPMRIQFWSNWVGV